LQALRGQGIAAHHRGVALRLGIALVLATAVACRGSVPASVHAEDGGTISAPQKGSPAGLKTLKLTRERNTKPVVGAGVDATADGLPPNRTVDLLWETVHGGWVVEDGYRFRGK